MSCNLANDNAGNCRKLDEKYENPIDNILIRISNNLNPVYCKLNLSPNHLTTFSLLFTLLSYYLFLKDYKYLAGILYFIGYFFDCADGCYARRYKLITQFGDYYDHISDMVKIIILYIILYKYSNSNNKFNGFIIFLAINVLFIITLSIQLGCQEKIYKKSNESQSLEILKRVCPNKNFIYTSRYFGCGTYHLLIAIFLMFF
jgi:phosphatidylglycerophosphate synthase